MTRSHLFSPPHSTHPTPTPLRFSFPHCYNSPVIILGITDDRAAGSAALVVDGRVVAAVQENKLEERVRQSAHGTFPMQSVLECCRIAGIAPETIERVVNYSASGQTRTSGADPSLLDHAEWRWSNHLGSHAAWTFFASPFDRAAIVLLCGAADSRGVAMAVGDGDSVRVVESSTFPNSPGWIYSQVTRALGYEPRRQEAKVQWLSLTGEPEFAEVFKQLIALDGTVDQSFLSRSASGAIVLGDRFFRALDMKRKANIAASLQARLEEVCIALAVEARRRFGVQSVCFGGGVAENALLVSRLEQELGAEHVFVPPAPGNAGSSIGAALQGKLTSLTASFGPQFGNNEIKSELDNCKLVSAYASSDEEIIRRTVDLLIRNDIVAWFQGRAEFGSRALGYRSMLANPRASYIDENINRFLKRREQFHPFAVSVPAESAGRYFREFGPCAQVLSSASPLTEIGKQMLGRFSFRGDLVRLHVVEQRTNPLFHRLLVEFGKRSEHPVLINSSLNLPGEPMAMRPRDAIRIFYASGLDALVIGGFVLRK